MAEPGIDTSALVSLVDSELEGQFHFLHGTEEEPFVGGEYCIYVLSDDHRQVSVRMPKAPLGPFTQIRVEMEANIRRRIDAALLQRFQPLLACDPTANNVLRCPFMVVGWANGRQLRWSDSVPSDEAKRQSILRTIAHTSIDLLRISQPGIPALDWIRGKIDRKIIRAKKNQLPFGTVSECEKQKSMTSKYWIPELNDAPHVLVHGDLSANNIIVDDSFHVESVIDLGWAEMIPLQFAAEYPRFLAYEPVHHMSGYCWTAKNSDRLAQDRQYYLTCIKQRAEQEGGLAKWYYTVLSRADEVNRYWWYTAASRADIHKAMVKCDWDPQSEIDGLQPGGYTTGFKQEHGGGVEGQIEAAAFEK